MIPPDDDVLGQHPKSTELRPEPADSPPRLSVTKMGGNAFTLDNQTWTVGVSRRPRSSASHSDADFTG